VARLDEGFVKEIQDFDREILQECVSIETR
jgi:hypothetical protein